MASLTLKDVPEELLNRLRTVAARERRSLNQETLVLIEGGLTARESAEERAQRRVQAWKALSGAWVSERAFDDEVASLYAARTAGRDIDL
jgi:hypothetical protein